MNIGRHKIEEEGEARNTSLDTNTSYTYYTAPNRHLTYTYLQLEY